MTKQQALEMLIAEGTVRRGAWLETMPRAFGSERRDRVRGMLLGVAIGDALGNTTESMNPGDRAARHGEIRDYLPNRHAGGRAVGVPSDDTQLTFRTVEHLLERRELDAGRLLDRFVADDIFGMGQATGEALDRYRTHGLDWHHIGARSAGNGGLMRIAPVLLPYLRTPHSDLWMDAVIATAVTHRDAAAIATSVAWVAMLWDSLALETPPAPAWWADRFIDVTAQVEGPGQRYRPRGGQWTDFDGTLTAWLKRCRPVFTSSPTVLEAGELWYSGAFLLETVPSVLHILTQCAGDPEEAIVRSVNGTRDNDTVAAIVGAAVGALHGTAAFPERWVKGLLGRTGTDDDDRVFTLIDAAVEAFA